MLPRRHFISFFICRFTFDAFFSLYIFLRSCLLILLRDTDDRYYVCLRHYHDVTIPLYDLLSRRLLMALHYVTVTDYMMFTSDIYRHYGW